MARLAGVVVVADGGGQGESALQRLLHRRSPVSDAPGTGSLKTWLITVARCSARSSSSGRNSSAVSRTAAVAADRGARP